MCKDTTILCNCRLSRGEAPVDRSLDITRSSDAADGIDRVSFPSARFRVERSNSYCLESMPERHVRLADDHRTDCIGRVIVDQYLGSVDRGAIDGVAGRHSNANRPADSNGKRHDLDRQMRKEAVRT